MNKKPLGHTAYGSIPHLPGSKFGRGDKGLSERQSAWLTTKCHKNDVIVVTEKMDGSCVSIANIDGRIIPLTRSGYIAHSSRWEMHHLFYDWAMQKESLWLGTINPGERLCGEWLAQAHGTRYVIKGDWDVFVPFDLIIGRERACYEEFTSTCECLAIEPAFCLHHEVGQTMSIDQAMDALTTSNHFCFGGDKSEGAVWRIERKGEVQFLGKYVRSDFEPGKYLPEIGGGEAVWNWRPKGETE